LKNYIMTFEIFNTPENLDSNKIEIYIWSLFLYNYYLEEKMNSKKELRKVIGLRLKEIRKALSFTQEVMARALATGRPNYTRIEIGDTFLNHVILHKLAAEFHVSMDWLICGRGSMFIQKKEDRDVKKKGSVQPWHQAQLGKTKNPEIAELLDYMEQIPFLYHDVMEFFYKFKIKHKEIIESMLSRSG
jgi:transcriptional regulator with XRE-family HTH domain